MTETHEQRTARLTRERNKAFAEWARVSSANYRPSIFCGGVLGFWLGSSAVLTAFLYFTTPGAPLWMAAIGGASATTFILLLVWFG